MRPLPNFGELGASVGTIVAGMGCAFCFPALGTLGASVGLGFLSAYEGVLITKVLPVLAVVGLLLGAFAWWQHRAHWRGALSTVGPLIVLAGLYPVWQLDIGWARAVFYSGLAIMVSVSVLDLIKPPGAVKCPTSSSVPS
jgi:mercuric ion transport protein